MEIGPVFRALFHAKSRFWLITLEIALTLALVVNCVAMIRDMRGKMLRPTGLDVDNILVANIFPYGEEFQEDGFVDNVRSEDLRALRALPGVRAATATHSIPLSGGGSATGRKPADELDMLNLSAPYFVVTDSAVETFGVEIEEGRDLVPEDFPPPASESQAEGEPEAPPPPRNVLITRAMADALFPGGGALGSQITAGEGRRVETVVGIIGRMDNSWPSSSNRERVLLIPGRPGHSRSMRYMVRAEPGQLEALYTTLEEKLLELQPNRMVEVETLREVKDRTFEAEAAISTMLGVVIFLLVGVTALGIVGLTSFSVTQRTRQIGTRRALGATRLAILRYFLVENWLVTGVGLTFGVALTLGVNVLLAQFLDMERLDWLLVVEGMLLLWAVGLLAALVPALRGTLVSPVIATRSI